MNIQELKAKADEDVGMIGSMVGSASLGFNNEDSDVDILYLCDRWGYNNYRRLARRLSNKAYMKDGESINYPSTHLDGYGFASHRNGKVNILITKSKKFHKRFLLANKLCGKLCIKDRDQRVDIHKAILYSSID